MRLTVGMIKLNMVFHSSSMRLCYLFPSYHINPRARSQMVTVTQKENKQKNQVLPENKWGMGKGNSVQNDSKAGEACPKRHIHPPLVVTWLFKK